MSIDGWLGAIESLCAFHKKFLVDLQNLRVRCSACVPPLGRVRGRFRFACLVDQRRRAVRSQRCVVQALRAVPPRVCTAAVALAARLSADLPPLVYSFEEGMTVMQTVTQSSKKFKAVVKSISDKKGAVSSWPSVPSQPGVGAGVWHCRVCADLAGADHSAHSAIRRPFDRSVSIPIAWSAGCLERHVRSLVAACCLCCRLAALHGHCRLRRQDRPGLRSGHAQAAFGAGHERASAVGRLL